MTQPSAIIDPPSSPALVLGTTAAGFPSADVLLLHRPGQPCLLPGDGFQWYYRGHLWRYRGYTDGMSSPQFTHAAADADPYGWPLRAAVPHDGGYHDGLEMWVEPKIKDLGYDSNYICSQCGADSNGPQIHQLTHHLVPPLTVEEAVQDLSKGFWKRITLTKDDCDQMFYDLLVVLAAGNEKKLIEARAFYEAVHLFGQTAFNQGRSIPV